MKSKIESDPVELSYLNLEPRRVLSADFSLIGGMLDLDSFSQVSDENILIQDNGNHFSFSLAEGVWSGTDSASVMGDGSNVLLADKAVVVDLGLDDDLSIGLDVTFGNADFSSLTNVNLVTNGNIGQLVGSTIVANNFEASAFRIDLASGTNDFDTIEVSANTRISIGDVDEVDVLGADANDKVKISASGIDVTGLVSAESILLDSDQGVLQGPPGGQFLGTNLLLTGEGIFRVDAIFNDIDNVAGDVDGEIIFANTDDFQVADLQCDDVEINGITTSGDLILFVNNGDMTQASNAALTVGGDVFFSAPNGNICFQFGDSDGDGLNDNLIDGAINVVTMGEVVIGEDDDLVVNMVNAGGNFWFIGNHIEINTAIVGSSVLLQANDGVSFGPGGSLDVNQLLLQGIGQFDLSGTTNTVENLAAEIDGNLELGTNSNLEIGTLEYVSNCGNTEVCGVTVSGDFLVTLDDGNLTQSASVIVGGRTVVDAGTGDVCLIGGDCDGDGANDNNFNRVEIVSANNIEIADVDHVTVESVAASGNVAVVGGTDGVGRIELSGDVSTGDQLLIQATDGATQTAGVITSNELLVGGQGDFSFGNLGNQVSRLAADVDGVLEIENGLDLEISSLVYLSSCSDLEVAICGLEVTGDWLITLDNASLKQSAGVIVGGRMVIDAGNGDVCFEFGDCNGDGKNENDWNVIEVVSAHAVELVDINGFTLGDVRADGDVAAIAGDNGTGQIVLDGSQVVGGTLLLQANDGVSQIAGSVAVDRVLLDGQGEFHLCLDNELGTTGVAGQVSADIDGELYLRNSNGVELVELTTTTKSGTVVAHSQFNTTGDLTIVSADDNGTAIFDSTQVNVEGRAAFVAEGAAAEIVVDDLFVAGSLGLVTADGNATVINQHANGLVFRGDDFPAVTATEVCPHFEQSWVNGDLFAQGTAGDITNEADATLSVSGSASLRAGTDNSGSVSGSNNEFNIKLGDQDADDIQFGSLAMAAGDASIQLDASVQLLDNVIGNPAGAGATAGTLFMNVDGSIVQGDGSSVSADQVAMIAGDYIVLPDLDADRVAFETQGSVDVSTLTSVPTNLPDDVSDEFAPRHIAVDQEYGLIVSTDNALVIGNVVDALGCQDDIAGITGSGGHAFVETVGQSNIEFDGSGTPGTLMANGQTFGIVADMKNDHVLTTIAGGDLTIGDNTALVSESGSVTDISVFNTDEGVNFANVPKEGPLFQLFLPTPDDTPTTRTVNNDDTQFIGLTFGRDGEQHFIVEVDWADGVQDVLGFSDDVGQRFERISHVFDANFLFRNFELPTDLRFYNEPTINLFDQGGSSNLNSLNDLNTNDNFVLAFSDSRPQGDLVLASVTRPSEDIRESISYAREELNSVETEVTEFGQAVVEIVEDVSEAYLVRLDDDGGEIEQSQQNLEETSVTQDVIAEWKRQVEDGTQYPPGQYRIKWTESGVTFSVEFEKGAEEDLSADELQTTDGDRDADPAERDPKSDDERLDEEPELPIETELPIEIIAPVQANAAQHGDRDDLGDQALPLVGWSSVSAGLMADANLGAAVAGEEPLDFDVHDANVDVQTGSRAGVILAGALALATRKNKDQEQNRNEEQGRGRAILDEISRANSKSGVGDESCGKISFVKSARRLRRIEE